ncbi:3-oxoacyl-ACP synthase [Paraburkholderia sp. Ac-20347]|uniref:3-oxoacyl-ACP synthase n=1 Tax=Paraburkholderia sp. Ac-20347 TaxID=2703892 RepID=UPI00197D445E|nr:3-oxoacyl-ACP synthase [Paraburkholderia sp. Ac-20347]MBN3808865.1 3-oxoacyl-ACP synthase [Paraburkholderia sp. Ac-20347]
MNTPVITAVTAWVPDTIPLSQCTAMGSSLRATSHPGWDAWARSWHPDYGHWLEACPGNETTGSPPVHSGQVTPDMTCMVPVETGTDLSGLAIKVANGICSVRPPGARPVDIVMFCHSTPDEHVSTSVAGRLCAEVGPPCFAFSVSQQHGASPFTALRLASDLLIAEPDVHTILIVAAEKWYPPFSRICGPGIAHGDAAGALLVERANEETDGLQLLDAAARRAPANIGRSTAGIPDARTITLLSMIDFFLARHGLSHGEIEEVVGQPGDPSLTDVVCDLLNRPKDTIRHQSWVHLGAAESIVRLAQALDCTACCKTYRMLLWGFGIGGFLGAALLATHSPSSPFQQDDIRPFS